VGESLATSVVERTLYPIFRRVEFRGKRRLIRALPAPDTGFRVAAFRGGFRLRLELSQPLQRDLFAGIYDHAELRIVRRLLGAGGDFVDVGAYVGMYAVAAATVLRGRGKVLAFEPHPESREQLERNLALNGCTNATVVSAAASARGGRARLAAPRHGDAAWSTLDHSRIADTDVLEVQATTVDGEVDRLGLRSVLVKIDVEAHELAVLEGMQQTLERDRPAILCEVGPDSTDEIERALAAAGYEGHRVGATRLHPLRPSSGYFNALFRPARVPR
jgi:FkbM family methyltransferase